MSRRYLWAGIAATVTAFMLAGPQGAAVAQEEGGGARPRTSCVPTTTESQGRDHCVFADRHRRTADG